MNEQNHGGDSVVIQWKTRDSILAVMGFAALISTLLLYSPAVIPFLRSEGFTAFVADFVIILLWSAVAFAFIAALFALRGKIFPLTMLIALGGAAYLCGSVMLLFLSFTEGPPRGLVIATAIIAAFGSVALCLVWGRIYSRFGMRQALIHTSLSSFVSGMLYEIIMLLSPEISSGVFLGCALLAVVLPALMKEGSTDALESMSALKPAGSFGSTGASEPGFVKPQKPAQTLKSLIDVLVGPVIGLLFFAFIMGSLRDIFAESYHLYLISLMIVSLLLFGYALRKKSKLFLRGLHQAFIPLSAIVLLAIIGITASVGQAVMFTTFFIYLVYTLAASITIATLCAIANAAEFPSDLVFSIGLFLFSLFSVFGQSCSELLVDFGINLVISVITTLYAFAVVLYGYLRLHKEQEGQQEPLFSDYQREIANRCGKIAENYHLTARENEVLVYLAQGHTGTYISEVLFISPNTVRTHIHNIYRKLDIASREDILKMTRIDQGER